MRSLFFNNRAIGLLIFMGVTLPIGYFLGSKLNSSNQSRLGMDAKVEVKNEKKAVTPILNLFFTISTTRSDRD